MKTRSSALLWLVVLICIVALIGMVNMFVQSGGIMEAGWSALIVGVGMPILVAVPVGLAATIAGNQSIQSLR